MIRELTSAASIGTASPEQQPIFPFSFVVLLLSRYFFGGFFRFLGFVILFDLLGPRRDLSGLLHFVFSFFLLLLHLELSSCRCFFFLLLFDCFRLLLLIFLRRGFFFHHSRFFFFFFFFFLLLFLELCFLRCCCCCCFFLC